MVKELLDENKFNPGYVKNITIKGLRSIKNLESFELQRMNVLIGANGAGKGNFLEAFNLIGSVVTGRVRDYGDNYSSLDGLFYQGNAATPEIELGISCDGWSHSSKLGTGQDGLVVIDENLTVGNMGSYVYVEEQINEMPVEENMYAVNEHDEMLLSRQDLVNQTWRQYKLGDRSHDSLIRGPSDIKNADELAPDFSNLASFLMGMRDNHPDSYSFLLSFLKLDIANFEDFILEPKHNADGTTTMDLAWKHKEFEFPMQHYHFSDGTLRFIAMATCMLQAKPPSVIIINEPELGLHFDTIESFVGLVKNNMQKSQIVIATQSPILVDKLNPEDVITVNQGKEGSEFKRLEHKDLDVWLENNTLGQLWVRNVVAAST